MLEVQDLLPIGPCSSAGLSSQVRSNALLTGPHTQMVGAPSILEHHSHLTSGAALGLTLIRDSVSGSLPPWSWLFFYEGCVLEGGNCGEWETSD